MDVRIIRKIFCFTLGIMMFFCTAYVWALTPTEQAKLLASDGANGDFFGYSVSVDGDITLH